jgi:pimeloyl-ACP methyl ester carboxylesterase
VNAHELRFGDGDVRLDGTVWVADQHLTTAGVVLVGGSGPADRSNGGYFNALRDRLVAAGAAVLAFDKRGVGGSTGDWASAGVGELAVDVAGAVDALRAHPAGVEGAVGLFGHSEGGWVALRAIAQGAAASYLVLNSCPAVSFLEAEVYALAAAGVGADNARSLFGRLRDVVEADADLATAARMLADEPDPMLHEVLEQTGFRLTDETYAQLRAWIGYAPDADLEVLRTPTLAIYGSADVLVPVQASVDRLAQLAPVARSQVFDGADHRLCIDGVLAPGYLDAVAAWCTSSRAGRPAESGRSSSQHSAG